MQSFLPLYVRVITGYKLIWFLIAPVLSSDSFIEHPRDLTVMEGDDALFECRMSENISTCIFSYHEHFLLSTRQNGTDFGFYSTNGYCSLTVRSVPGDHDGNRFMCLLNTGPESNIATLRVLSKFCNKPISAFNVN